MLCGGPYAIIAGERDRLLLYAGDGFLRVRGCCRDGVHGRLERLVRHGELRRRCDVVPCEQAQNIRILGRLLGESAKRRQKKHRFHETSNCAHKSTKPFYSQFLRNIPIAWNHSP